MNVSLAHNSHFFRRPPRRRCLQIAPPPHTQAHTHPHKHSFQLGHVSKRRGLFICTLAARKFCSLMAFKTGSGRQLKNKERKNGWSEKRGGQRESERQKKGKKTASLSNPPPPPSPFLPRRLRRHPVSTSVDAASVARTPTVPVTLTPICRRRHRRARWRVRSRPAINPLATLPNHCHSGLSHRIVSTFVRYCVLCSQLLLCKKKKKRRREKPLSPS